MTAGEVVVLNGRWPLWLPEHRAAREEWRTGWEVARLDSMFSNVRRGDVVYDIGAEVGDMAALYETWVQRDRAASGGVVLFEPNVKAWPQIAAIWMENALRPPLACWPGFVGEEDRLGGTPWPDGWPVAIHGPIVREHGFQSYIESAATTPTITVDTAAETFPPDVLTMDVEGAEVAVLEGADRTLREIRPLVWVSVHPTMLGYDYERNPEDVHRHMAERGYRMQFLGAGHEHWWFYWPKEREVILP